MKILFNKLINFFTPNYIVKKENNAGKDVYYVSSLSSITTLPDLVLNFYMNIEKKNMYILLNINILSLPTPDQIVDFDLPNDTLEFNVVTDMPIDLEDNKLKFFSVVYVQDNFKLLVNNKDFNPNVGCEVIFDYKFVTEEEYFFQVDQFSNS